MKISGISLSSSCPAISHLFFADDSLIFCKASIPEIYVVKRTLLDYKKASVQKINFDKSVLWFSPNVKMKFRKYVQSIMGMSLVSSLGNYLGIPSSLSRSKNRDFARIKDKLWKVVQGWKANLFSVGGKEVLIKSVTQAIPTYVMSYFKLPSSFCLELSKIIACFWWGTTETRKRIHWVSWDRICWPKELEGLNFRDLELFNKALLAKQLL